MSESLTRVEQHLLAELLEFHVARRNVEATNGHAAPATRPQFRQPLRRSHQAQNLAVLVALAAVGIFMLIHVTGLGSGPALAATPPPLHYIAPSPGAPTASQLLLSLARRADRQAVPAPTTGAFAYVETKGWYLAVGQGTGGNAFPQTSQSWLQPDGSGRVVTATGVGSSRHVSVMSAGPRGRLLRLSKTPGAVARELSIGHPTSDGPQERLVAFVDTASQQPIPPASEAAILRLLARTPDLVNRGTVVDRAHRRGVAVSLDAPHLGSRYTLVLNPRNGQLLGFEETLIRHREQLHLRLGAVLAYKTFIKVGYAPNTTTTP